ncbi:MAG TPA: DegT/DnrJ/EryC1/StrS family aminotransferase [Bryobacteraceae bacterium]
MKIPMVNLQPMLEATESAWQANLRRLFERMHFILGEHTAAFETELAKAFGARYAVGVGTGTSAIELALRAAGLGGSGAEVICPALTSPFTAHAIIAAGCRPTFADVDPEHLLLDPADAESRIARKTAAILPVHLYGQPCDLAPLRALARRRGLLLVQDACQAHGAPLRYADTAAFSFYPTKNLPCLGDGGAIVTDSRRIADAVCLLRDGGRRNDQVARIPALNSRLDEMQACYLRAFLPKLQEWNRDRARLAALYDRALETSGRVRPVARRAGSVCHLYVVRAARRDRLRAQLAAQDIATGVHYPVPLHMQPAFREFAPKRGGLPVSERACREILSLPLWPYMPDGMVEEVAARLA